jgi:hypothetical protein
MTSRLRVYQYISIKLSDKCVSRKNLVPVILPAYTAYEDGTQCSETSAYKIQTPGITQKQEYNTILLPVLLS